MASWAHLPAVLTLHLHCVLWLPVLHRGRGWSFQVISVQVLPFLLAMPETENQAVELGRGRSRKQVGVVFSP